MRKTTLSIAVLCLTQWAQAQVTSNVMVSVAGNTEVHVFEDVTNTGDFDINASALLHVRGDIELSGSSHTCCRAKSVLEVDSNA